MRSFSDLIAATRTDDSNRKPAGALACALFVAAVIGGSTVAAYWIGTSLARQSAPATLAYSDGGLGF